MIPRTGTEPLHLCILIGWASEARMECTDSVTVMSVYPVFRWSCCCPRRNAQFRIQSLDDSLLLYYISNYDILANCQDGRAITRDHLPANPGFRFSTNALAPS